MEPYEHDDFATIFCGDCLDVMRGMEPSSIDAIVTDPPYGLEFMGKDWDAPWKHSGGTLDDPSVVGGFQDSGGGNPFSRSRVRLGRSDMQGFEDFMYGVFVEALRVAKPGAHLVAFGGSRTFHRLACAIEDAGWEIRDTLSWNYSSGFPKSHNVSRAIDKEAGEAVEVGKAFNFKGDPEHKYEPRVNVDYTPISEAAQDWDGWGTALKPSWEPIVLARKPVDGTIAHNVLTHGTGALNIDGCRVPMDEAWEGHDMPDAVDGVAWGGDLNKSSSGSHPLGRWPANTLVDNSDEVTAVFPDAGGDSAARFFSTFPFSPYDEDMRRMCYCPKPAVSEREGGLFQDGGLDSEPQEGLHDGGVGALRDGGRANTRPRLNIHSTVKPVALMRWLVRLVAPPNGVVLDPFMGSGSTLVAARAEGVQSIGIDQSDEYCKIARGRMSQGVLF